MNIHHDEATKQAPFIWRWMRSLNRWMARNYRRGFGPRKLVLLLTTLGRKSGLPRVTPLQYEAFEGIIYIGSARGTRADWYRNLSVHPEVTLQIGDETLVGEARCLTDPKMVADFLAMRLQRHPVMIRLLMWFEGLPLRFSRADLERFAAEKAVVAIYPAEPRVTPAEDGLSTGMPEPGAG